MAGGLSCFLMYLGYFVVPQRVSWCFIVSFDISFSHCVSWCWVCCQHEHFGLCKIRYMLRIIQKWDTGTSTFGKLKNHV